MLTAVVTFAGPTFEVSLVDASFVTAEEGHEAEGPESDLNPIFPELKEVVWGFGAFVVLALAMRLFLFRKVRDGMTSRYDMIEGDFEKAETLTASARADVAEYEAQVASVRADAQSRVEAARATLEAERTEKLTEVNARIAEKRSAAAAEVEAAKAASRGQVETAVADVATQIAQLATGKAPSTDVVSAAVSDAMNQGVSA
ncbi:MAG: ATP synthase F0 subunit B [Ilumatobacteraceae bacterium]